MVAGKTISRICPLLFQVLVIFSWAIVSAQAKDVVSGRYTSISDTRIVFSISIASPGPPSLIIQHYYPSNVQLTATTPQASVINSSQGFAKWFLKDVTPGTVSFTLSFNRPVSPTAIRAVLRYQDPKNMRFIETEISP